MRRRFLRSNYRLNYRVYKGGAGRKILLRGLDTRAAEIKAIRRIDEFDRLGRGNPRNRSVHDSQNETIIPKTGPIIPVLGIFFISTPEEVLGRIQQFQHMGTTRFVFFDWHGTCCIQKQVKISKLEIAAFDRALLEGHLWASTFDRAPFDRALLKELRG